MPGKKNNRSKRVVAKQRAVEVKKKHNEPQKKSEPPVEKKVEELLPEVIKHPLENSWGMWLITIDKRNWEDNLIKLTTFDTVEDYWCLHHHMKRPTELEFGNEYAIFKKDIRPMWEDPVNKHGGRWVINVDKNSESDINAIWTYIVLLVIGESFNDPAICGAVANLRSKRKISVWIADCKNEKAIKKIGKRILDTIGLKGRLLFHQHSNIRVLYTM